MVKYVRAKSYIRTESRVGGSARRADHGFRASQQTFLSEIKKQSRKILINCKYLFNIFNPSCDIHNFCKQKSSSAYLYIVSFFIPPSEETLPKCKTEFLLLVFSAGSLYIIVNCTQNIFLLGFLVAVLVQILTGLRAKSRAAI